jgi:hypothetical protein
MFNDDEERIQQGLIHVARKHGLGLHDLATLCLVLEILLSDGAGVMDLIHGIRERESEEQDHGTTMVPKYSFLKSIRRWSFLKPALVEFCNQIRSGVLVGRKSRRYIDDVKGAALYTATEILSWDQYTRGLLGAYNWYFAVGRKEIGNCI